MRVLAISALAACTQLNFLPLGEAELPYWRGSTPDPWSDGVHEATTTGDASSLRLITNLPMRCDDCADRDADGLADAWEAMVLERLRPVVALHEEEPLIYDPHAKVGAVGRVTPAADGRIRVFMMLGYSFDYGRCAQGAHRGDSERVALDLEVRHVPRDGRSIITVQRFYTAAHEDTPSDVSRISTAADIELIDDVHGPRWLVYASRAKHGSFPSRAACRAAADGACTTEDCQAVHLVLFPIVNAGEPTAPLVRATALGAIWSHEPFCGSAPGNLPCASAVRGKLLDDPFVR